MNEIVNKFLFTGDKFMLEMNLKQPGFFYSACWPFTKNKELKELESLCKQEIQIIFTKMNLIRLVFKAIWHRAILRFKKRTASDKVLRDKGFKIAKNLKYDGYQRRLASMVYKFFDKNSSSGNGIANIKTKQNMQLAEELHKPIIGNFKNRTVYSGSKYNIWGSDLSDMQLIRSLIKYLDLYYVLLIFLVNMLGLFLWEIKNMRVLLMYFRKF